MKYLSYRFSRTTSLVMLLMLTIGTAWLFRFATKANSVAEGWLQYSMDTYESRQPVRHKENSATSATAASATRPFIGQ